MTDERRAIAWGAFADALGAALAAGRDARDDDEAQAHHPAPEAVAAGAGPRGARQ